MEFIVGGNGKDKDLLGVWKIADSSFLQSFFIKILKKGSTLLKIAFAAISNCGNVFCWWANLKFNKHGKRRSQREEKAESYYGAASIFMFYYSLCTLKPLQLSSDVMALPGQITWRFSLVFIITRFALKILPVEITHKATFGFSSTKRIFIWYPVMPTAGWPQKTDNFTIIFFHHRNKTSFLDDENNRWWWRLHCMK